MVNYEVLKDLSNREGNLNFPIEINGETRIVIDEESGKILVFKEGEITPEQFNL